MKPFIAVMLFCLSTLSYGETRDVSKFFDQNLGDLKSELATAKNEGKKAVLIMFEAEDCPFCHRMKSTILNQSEVQDFYDKNFLVFSMDINGDNPLVDFFGQETTEKAYARLNRVRATPVFAFFDLEGKLITRYTGATKDTKEFLKLGQYIIEGAYKGMTFTKYKSLPGRL